MGEYIKDLVYDMINISEKKLEYLKEIYRFTNKQKRFIRLERIDDLLKQVKLRDSYMKKIDILNLTYYRNYKELKAALNVDSIEAIDSQQYIYITKLKELLNKMKLLLIDLKSIDNENWKNLSISTNEMRSRLKNVKQGKKIDDAYAGYRKQVTSIFMDKRK